MKLPIWPAYRKFLANHTVDGVLLMQAICETDPTGKADAGEALALLANEEERAPMNTTPTSIAIDHVIVLLRVLMLAAKRFGCPLWVNPSDRHTVAWLRVRDWMASARLRTESSCSISDTVRRRSLADLDAWLALFDDRSGRPSAPPPAPVDDGPPPTANVRDNARRARLLRVLIPAAFMMGWRPDVPDPEATLDVVAGDARWRELFDWVECLSDTTRFEGAAGASRHEDAQAWLTLYREARPS